MTSEYHAIVDAGGNIYPGTFAKKPEVAQSHHFFKNNPGINECGVEYMVNWWKERQADGDRCVCCTVETHETCKVTIQSKYEFTAPEETYEVTGRGTVYVVRLNAHIERHALNNAVIGKSVLLGGRKFIVRGVESHCVPILRANSTVGLLGEYVTKSPAPAAP